MPGVLAEDIVCPDGHQDGLLPCRLAYGPELVVAAQDNPEVGHVLNGIGSPSGDVLLIQEDRCGVDIIGVVGIRLLLDRLDGAEEKGGTFRGRLAILNERRALPKGCRSSTGISVAVISVGV